MQLCTMKTCTHHLLKLIYVSLFPVLEAHKVEVMHEVTGSVGSDVILLCQLPQEQQSCYISQIQWDFFQPEGNKSIIFVSSSIHGNNVPESHLKGRLETEKQSLIIKHVEMADAGSYICILVTFPCGSIEKTIKLVVQEKKLLSAGIVLVIVITVLLLLMIVAAIVYIRRREETVRLHVLIDTSGPVAAANRPSFIVKEKEVVYSHIKLKTCRDSSSSKQYRDLEQGDNVTYADVTVLHQKPK